MSDNQDGNNDVPPWLQPVPEADEPSGFFAGKRGSMFAAGIAVGLVAVFVVAIVLLYDDAPRSEPRIVTADTSPIKRKPDDPGGMDIEHQDKQVFDAANGLTASNRVELGAQPEQPVDEIPDLPVEDAAATAPETDDKIGDIAEAALNDAQQSTENAAASTAQKPVAEQPVRQASEPVTTPEPEAAPTPAVQQQSDPQFRVQLGAYGSTQTAEGAWRSIRGKFLNQLRDLTPSYEPVQAGDRTLYRLRVGSLATRADADEVCIALRAQQQACIVVKP